MEPTSRDWHPDLGSRKTANLHALYDQPSAAYLKIFPGCWWLQEYARLLQLSSLFYHGQTRLSVTTSHASSGPTTHGQAVGFPSLSHYWSTWATHAPSAVPTAPRILGPLTGVTGHRREQRGQCPFRYLTNPKARWGGVFMVNSASPYHPFALRWSSC